MRGIDHVLNCVSRAGGKPEGAEGGNLSPQVASK